MVETTGGKSGNGLYVLNLKIGELLENLGGGETGGEQIQHVNDPNSHATNARPSTTLLGIHSDSLSQICLHRPYLLRSNGLRADIAVEVLIAQRAHFL